VQLKGAIASGDLQKDKKHDMLNSWWCWCEAQMWASGKPSFYLSQHKLSDALMGRAAIARILSITILRCSLRTVILLEGFVGEGISYAHRLEGPHICVAGMGSSASSPIDRSFSDL
jgi:hypothetical protein